ncbi:MAG: hypothetical protein HUK00_03850 [Bacteroidaceae bacterium]|nr:hypothetical protein [Bacteroidaceae bacterium]
MSFFLLLWHQRIGVVVATSGKGMERKEIGQERVQEEVGTSGRRLRIRDGVLEVQEGGVMYCGENGSECFFPGVTAAFYGRMHDRMVPKTAYQLNGHIGVSPSWETFGVMDFAHEYGHHLQQKVMGWKYYIRGLCSMCSMVMNRAGHRDEAFEREATRLGAEFVRENMRRRE